MAAGVAILSGFWETIKAFALMPPVQAWFPFGILAGALYWPFGSRRPLALIIVTLVIIVPPAIWFLVAQNPFELLSFLLSIFYIMTGFIGFCAGWIPGLLVGYLFFAFIRRRPEEVDGH